ncbi:MAG: hypothetical protein J7M40_02770, partial [Planctomycetes bacterium]|nr:hypothetical protein [Planctomycetota bacterium]
MQIKRNVSVHCLLLFVCMLSVSSADQSVGEASGLIERFDLRHSPLKLESVGGKDNYIEALGEQASIWGTAAGALEAWAYPFKLAGNLTMEFSTDGGKAFAPVSGLLIGQTATPQMAQLHYAGKRFKMTQTLFVPRNLPGGAMLLDIDSSVDLQIAVSFKVSLAPMLMNTKDKPAVHWDSANKLLRAVEKDRKVELLVWSPLATLHEITQSLPYYPDYFDKYKYAYIHASSGTYFLAACGNYYRQTGDIDFIRRNFGKLRKMLDWCASAVDDDDGLLRIGPKEWGSSESSFAVGKDTQMEGMWLCALRQMEYLAKAMDDSKLAERCRRMAREAQASIEQKFWDEDLSS